MTRKNSLALSRKKLDKKVDIVYNVNTFLNRATSGGYAMLRNIIKRLSGLVLAAIISFGLIVGSAVAGEAEDAFVKTLVAHSPWLQKWETFSRSGTVELSFSVQNGKLTGKLSNFSNATADTPIKNISVKGTELRFVNSRSGTEFTYRLNSDGTMSGTFEGVSSRGNPVEGTMTATPTSGAKN